MTSETDQLANDFEEVNTRLAEYPQIHLAETEGDPPATYEVEYRLNGLARQEDGSIGQNKRHRLRINLPFGYPHFPPTVKPLTPLFHPDIDPDAVRIALYWQKNPSLAALIIHIGEIICGQTFNLEEPFNQEAADWYSDNAADFPLDEVRQGEPEDEDFEEAVDPGLSLEIDSSEEGLDEKIEEIKHHIDRNEIVTADKLLAALSSSSPQAKQLEKIVASTLAKRDALFQKLEVLENEDRFADAYNIFKKIQKIAVDTPALSDVGQRLQQSQAMLDAFSQPEPTAGIEEPPAADKEKKKKKAAKKAPVKQKAKPARAKEAIRRSIELPIKKILAGILLLATVGGCTMLYSNSMEKLLKIEQDWIEIKYKRTTTTEHFKEKRIEAEKLLSRLKSIYVPGIGKKELKTEIENYLNSPEFKKGEAGDVEYKGIALPPLVIRLLEPLDKKINRADAIAQKGAFTKALTLYQQIFVAAKNAKPDALAPHSAIANAELDKRIKAVQEKMLDIKEQADQEEQRAKYKQVEEQYQQAKNFFQELKNRDVHPTDPQDGTDIRNQWRECISRLEHVEDLLNKTPAINSRERQHEVQSLLAYAHLYEELEIARQAYQQGNFSLAIKEYEKALGLLKQNRSLLDAIYKDATVKVGQTILVLNVSLELREAVEAENNNNLRQSLRHYKNILRILRTSAVGIDDSLKQLRQYIRSKVDEQSLQAAKSSNQEWWKKNYQRIFKKEFPSTRVSLLSKPRIYFIKVQNGRLLYTIRCSEKGITLELNYQYNMATGKWSPYYGKL
ncbi:Ubiquitin-conjugating enzyme [Candidatus Electrothrix gigas]